MFEIEKQSMRDAVGQTIFDMAKADPSIVVVGVEAIKSMGLSEFAATFPERTTNNGIAEQNTMAIAAGMATAGMNMVVTGFATFLTMRACEQFRTFVCYPNLRVHVVGGMGGLSAGTEGPTHQALEDYGILRIFPNVVIACPADYEATKVITRALMQVNGPTYMRVGKRCFKKVFGSNYQFEIGKANLLGQGTQATIIVNGAAVPNAFMAYNALRTQGIDVRLLEMPCIKPIDEAAIIMASRETGAIVTVEDHFAIGGLGSAVCEVTGQNAPCPVKILGIPDRFPDCGDHYELLDSYGMSVENIVASVKEIIAKKAP